MSCTSTHSYPDDHQSLWHANQKPRSRLTVHFFHRIPRGGSKIGQVGGETFLDWTGYNYNWQFMQETGHYAAVNLLAGHENGSPGSISWCCVTASGAVTSSSGYPGSVRCSFIEYN